MKTNYRITFNGVTTVQHLWSDDQAFEEAEKCTDSALQATVEKLIDNEWHWWESNRGEWLPYNMTRVSMTVLVEGWMPDDAEGVPFDLNAARIEIPGCAQLKGVSLKIVPGAMRIGENIRFQK
jgi:hypothetical protein